MDRQKTQADFTPQQIVCLETGGSLGTPPREFQGDRRLYAAVIQFIEQQQNYWLRPLCLVEWREGRS